MAAYLSPTPAPRSGADDINPPSSTLQTSSPENEEGKVVEPISTPQVNASDDYSSLLEPDRSKRSTHILRWYHQADSIIALSALCALLIGGLGLLDALILNYQLKHKDDKNKASRFAAPFRSSDLPADTALICFGLATALAWIAAQRASFRAASMDANKFLFRGVRQKDLDRIFTLRFLSASWFRWRLGLWKSTLFCIVQVIFYVGIALCYRAAFKNGLRTETVNLNTTSSNFLLGCRIGPRASYFSMYTYLMGATLQDTNDQEASGYQWTQSAGLGQLDDTSKPQDWQVGFAWHGSGFARSINVRSTISTKDFRGPFLAGMLQLATNETLPGSSCNGTQEGSCSPVEVAEHPRCGLLPRQCVLANTYPYDTTAHVIRTCFWVGLKVLNMTATFDSTILLDQASLGQENTSMSKDECPLRLDSSIYWSWLARSGRANSRTVPGFAGPLHSTLQHLISGGATGIFASLIAEVQESIRIVNGDDVAHWAQMNTSAITDFELLRRNGIIVTESAEQAAYNDYGKYMQFCGIGAFTFRGEVDLDENSPLAPPKAGQFGLPIYTGMISYPKTTNEWTTYQTGASVMLIIWGIVLAVMAWPFKRLIIKGQLDQYMSLGANIGREDMEGASSGHWGAESDKIWRLRHRECDDGFYRIWFEEATAQKGIGVADLKKIQTRSKYL